MKKSLLALAVLCSGQAYSMDFMLNVNGQLNQQAVAAEVAAKGGVLKSCIPQIGVCQVAFGSADAAASSGMALVPDATAFVPQVPDAAPASSVQSIPLTASFANPPASGDDDFFFDLQWGHVAVGAVDAWNAGYRGAGVRVAVLDSGADADHPDLAPNINTDLSRSFVMNEAWDYAGTDTFNHGTHTAGTIAAADNGFGVIGVAPEAELVILKVLSADSGTGSSYGTMQAMVYAADNGVDIINMSLGLSVRRNGLFDVNDTPYDTSDDIRFDVGGKDGIAQFIGTYAKAANYARKHGVTLFASAGNEATDLDHTDSLMHLPSGLPAVNAVSALGPQLWGANSGANLDNLAIYSNYGQSEIEFAAPGGDYSSLFIPGGTSPCTVAGLTRFCYVFDFVFSTGNNGWYWSVGTSMASPHAAGVAALIVSANGGRMDPPKLEAEMRRLAQDLGKPGRDDVYGQGKAYAPAN
ncbi:S8 family peptidase [Shewanella litorisediminis]|uniref:S8 family serine peptidase n=1 Tax=Shewanella litorisediminis TaxID=1173586 RepID=A0ABX7G3I8_9GAMM|nr:S8 family serine peptidase [Shewanella litorisediminis]MCL2917339.1 S8 family serine peptidase [Shewanella litorisediminis]QRH01807.1 S8 family serine peptidase [Shewanella litorisediminis]